MNSTRPGPPHGALASTFSTGSPIGLAMTTTAPWGLPRRLPRFLASGVTTLAIPLHLLLSFMLTLAVLCAPGQARAAEASLSKESQACVKCHDDPTLIKQLEDGKSLSMSVSSKAFLASMHKDNDCTDCHDDLDDKTHGKVKTPLKSRRELAAAMQDSCVDCHKKKVKQYDDGLHAALVKAGNDKAPLCADCHNAHTQASVKVLAPIAQTSCASCHEPIFKAYENDVHGLARVAQGRKSPSCADCHQSHDLEAASLDNNAQRACLKCHENTADTHRAWLPNTGLHFASISCAVCHSPTAQRRVNLRLYDAASQKLLQEKTGVPQFVRRTQDGDPSKDGLDEKALFTLLQQFNQDGIAGAAKVVLRGRLEVASGPEAHQLTAKDKALSDCDTCHKRGAEPFQRVVLSIAGGDGRLLRHDIDKNVLTSLTAIESVRGFYAIGSTGIGLLDVLLLLVVSGSIAGPAAHWAVRRLTRGARQRREAEEAAAAAAAATAATPIRPSGDDQA